MATIIIKFKDRTGSRTITGTIDRVILYPNGMFGVFPTGMNREFKYEIYPSTMIDIQPIEDLDFRKFSF